MKKLVLLVMMVAMAATSYAQPQDRKMDGNRTLRNPEQMIDARVQRMQEQLMLDDAAAKKFAPIYKEYLQSQYRDMKDGAKMGKKPREAKQLTDAELVARQKDRMAQAKKRAELKENYYNKLSKVLTPRQLEKVFFGKQNGTFGGDRFGRVGLHKVGGRNTVKFGNPRGDRNYCNGDNCNGACDKANASAADK